MSIPQDGCQGLFVCVCAGGGGVNWKLVKQIRDGAAGGGGDAVGLLI